MATTTLTGTEAQIAAAEKVRRFALARIEAKLKQYEESLAEVADEPDTVAALEKSRQPLIETAEKLSAVRKASWWLDHRHNDFTAMEPQVLAHLLRKA